MSATPAPLPPPASAEPGPFADPATQRRIYDLYCAAYNRAALSTVESHFTEDIKWEFRGSILSGKHEIRDDYMSRASLVTEQLTVEEFVGDAHTLAAILTTRFTALSDLDDFEGFRLRKGQTIRVLLSVFYNLRHGLIARTRVYPGGPPKLEEGWRGH